VGAHPSTPCRWRCRIYLEAGGEQERKVRIYLRGVWMVLDRSYTLRGWPSRARSACFRFCLCSPRAPSLRPRSPSPPDGTRSRRVGDCSNPSAVRLAEASLLSLPPSHLHTMHAPLPELPADGMDGDDDGDACPFVSVPLGSADPQPVSTRTDRQSHRARLDRLTFQFQF